MSESASTTTTGHSPEQPATDREGSLERPGSSGSITAEMSTQPDHGEASYRGSGKLTGKVAIVTGGDSGIGRAIALAFAREGADVVIGYLPGEQDDADETARLIREAGQQDLLVAGDLTSEDACDALIQQTIEKFSRIDILVNNAAYQMAQTGGIEAITTALFDRIMKTNLYAMFWLCKKALPHMQEGSSIINTSSVQAADPSPPLLDYAMTKGAIINFTRGLAAMVAERKIRVNSVAPGPIWTPLVPSTMPKEMVEGFGHRSNGRQAGRRLTHRIGGPMGEMRRLRALEMLAKSVSPVVWPRVRHARANDDALS